MDGREIEQVAAMVHLLLGKRQRIVIEVSAAAIVLGAWVDLQERMKARGITTLHLRLEDLRDPRLARRWLRRAINDRLHLELHELCTGDHPLLWADAERGDGSGPF